MVDNLTTFSLHEEDFLEELYLIEFSDFFDEIINQDESNRPPINTYCDEDYECSGGQCTVCLNCQRDCLVGCMTDCQKGCMDSCQTGSSCESGEGGHSHNWVEYHGVWDCTSPIGHQWYKKCSTSTCREEVGMGVYKDGVKSWTYTSFDNTSCKKYGNCDHCGKTYYEYPTHDTSGQPQYEENGWYKKKCKNCGTGVLISQVPVCDHATAKWGSWKTNPSNPLQCKRDKYCPKCEKIIDTQTKEHNFVHNGQYQAHDATYHKKVGYCGDCSFSPLVFLEVHSFGVGGLCVCGASSGGGSTNPPSITSFTAKPNPDGMAILCSVSATNAVRYIYNLYDAGDSMLITTSGSTTSTSYTFPSMPETNYIVGVDAINKIGVVAKKSLTVTTPKALPKDFKWSVPPSTGNNFSDTVTATDWEKLQTTVNAWRNYYKLPLYDFVQHQLNETSFTVPYRDADYTYKYYNQIINGISTIPKFGGSLPSKLERNPAIWLAGDFSKFEAAVNSLKNTIGQRKRKNGY